MRNDPAFLWTAPDIQTRVHIFPDLDVFSGWEGLVEFWARWLETWEAFTYEIESHRDLGAGRVLTVLHITARGRGGIPVELKSFELRLVRAGSIVVWEVFGSEEEALQAAQ